MKTKLFTAILLTIVLVFVVGGATRAQSPTYTVHLPFVAKSSCTPIRPTAYIATGKPVVKVGEIVTVVSVLVNDCAHVGEPVFGLQTEPSGILSTTGQAFFSFPSIPIGEYQEVTFTLQAIDTGVVTVTTGMNYETLNNGTPPTWYFDTVGSAPAIVRVLPYP